MRPALPWLIFMDIQMPKMVGIQAAKKILHDDVSTKVVMVTDYDNELFRWASLSAGAMGFVSEENLIELTNSILP